MNAAIEPGADFQDRLLRLVERVASEQARAWLAASLDDIRAASEPVETLLMLSPLARRKLGRTSMAASDQAITTDAGPVALMDWELGDAGRAILVLEAADRVPPTESVPKLYRAGDETERISMTRALPLFDNTPALKPVALETGRINSAALFSALALGNPYPAAHYTDHELNQLVLKSLFMGLPIERIVGLTDRANQELSRMCEDYYDERTAAGRAVPVDIWLALGPFASRRGVQLMRDHLRHADPRHQYFATAAMKQRGE